jgi:translation initiation factor eIF-2B subunit epsilon
LGESRELSGRCGDVILANESRRDVLRRWSFPLVPDLNEPGGVQYELRKGNVYIARDNVVLSRSAQRSRLGFS